MNRDEASRLRQQTHVLRKERDRIEAALLKRRQMLRASFLVRFLGTSTSKRTKPAFYLAFRRQGRPVFRYVPAQGHRAVKAKADAWGEYRRLVAAWVKNARKLEAVYRKLGEAQAELPDGQGGDGG
jgi:hypothetical protein